MALRECEHAAPKIVILRVLEATIILQAVAHRDGAPKHHRSVYERIVKQHAKTDKTIGFRLPIYLPGSAGRINHFHGAADKSDIGSRNKELDLTTKPVCTRDVVGVLTRN